jgi:hypothetical protein
MPTETFSNGVLTINDLWSQSGAFSLFATNMHGIILTCSVQKMKVSNYIAYAPVDLLFLLMLLEMILRL